MKRLLFLLLTLFAGCAGFSGYAQPIERAGLDSFFNTLDAHRLDMGSITITKNGVPVYRRSFGKEAPADAEYRIGSITKVFTGVMIYQLIDEKKLSLDDTLSEFFPQVPNAGKITIAEMLGHRTGIA
ncbi:MAG TPA: serine hydrolase domain-containing protein, partial [Verrucomicrobiae bacterium]|nr:serine hydrolase domain-containing protein [Verrucomicrobiae bacterium]